MARRDKSGPISWLLERMSDWAITLLTKPVNSYSLQIPNDIAALKRHIRKGDVILVEGNERISECIKYLTQSSWSHSALYVGDEPIRRNPELKAPLVAQYGEEANFLRGRSDRRGRRSALAAVQVSRLQPSRLPPVQPVGGRPG